MDKSEVESLFLQALECSNERAKKIHQDIERDTRRTVWVCVVISVVAAVTHFYSDAWCGG